MFGGRSSDVISTIQNLTTDVVSRAMQRAGAVAAFDQSFQLDCTDFNAGTYYVDCLRLFEDLPDKDREEICGVYRGFTCQAHSVTMNQAVNLNLTSDQQAAVKQLVENDLKANLEADIRRETNLIRLGPEIQTEIRNLSDITSNLVNENLQDMYASFGARQRIEGFGGTIEFVTLDQAIDYNGDYLQRSGAYNEAVMTLSQSIQAELKKQTGTLDVAIIVSIGILGSLLLLLLGAGIKKAIDKGKAKKST